MEKLDIVIAAIAAIGGLGMAAMSLVDAFKAIPGGGVSRIGFRYVRATASELSEVLTAAIGADWESVILSHWINGRPRDDQIAAIRSILRLGLNDKTAAQLAGVAKVDPETLAIVAGKLATGAELDQQDVDLLGRAEAAVGARLDAAFDLADQAYRNASRVLAGVVAVALAQVASLLVPNTYGWGGALLVGVLAVPIAPVAKDLVSALTAAAKAVKAERAPSP
ncbi:hypothetical protein [Caulobacter sp.]|uniref:hypothetical protein n=1 Tax=Caulobacter sp. TaxID=78 RepID=UPI002B49D2EC|nr:hypothetical protein [Caulobacter sp.]HJV41908.1 hypothetical protein [Caulobacter sp.]